MTELQPNLTKQLESEGIAIHYEENTELIPKAGRHGCLHASHSGGNMELQFYQNNNYKVVKRSDILKIITESSFNVCVAGTHGKTTVSTMIAHLLRHSEYGCNAFLGGISSNYATNFWSSEKNVCVIEADEYDRSFLKLSPNIAVITAVDPDHLDIYGTAQEFEKAFIEFAGKVKPGGCLIVKHGLPFGFENSVKAAKTYSLNDGKANVYAANIKVVNGSYVFDVIGEGWKLEQVTLHIGGLAQHRKYGSCHFCS